MGPQNADRSSRQLYGGSDNYKPSDRANSAVKTATAGQSKSSQVVGEGSNQVGHTPTQEKTPKQNVGGSIPSPKEQAAARYNEPGTTTSVNDEKA
jgi:hypothetical protein